MPFSYILNCMLLTSSSRLESCLSCLLNLIKYTIQNDYFEIIKSALILYYFLSVYNLFVGNKIAEKQLSRYEG